MTQTQEEKAIPLMERAEVLADQLGQRVGRWVLLGSVQVRRMVARLQEEIEDISCSTVSGSGKDID